MPTSTAARPTSLAESASPPPIYESGDQDEVSFFSFDFWAPLLVVPALVGLSWLAR